MTAAAVAAALAAVTLAAVPVETVQIGAPSFPAKLDAYLTTVVKLGTDERRRLANGGTITKLLEVDESKEVGVFGAVWIAAPMRRYVEAVTDIERFERGAGFRVTKRISVPPRLDDFAELRLPEEDLDDLRACRVGSCEVKLGEPALRRFRTEIDWRAPDADAAANALMRRLALEYVTGYLEGGNDRLPVYRDTSRPTFVAQEFRSMVDQMPELTTFMPDMRRYLLDYPAVTVSNATSLLYWQETVFGLKPTIRISHLTIREGPTDTVVASKMLYASHYFRTGLELRALVPDPSRGAGFWFVTVSRSRTDGLSGFTGIFVRRRVRSQVQEATRTILQTTKRRLERAE